MKKLIFSFLSFILFALALSVEEGIGYYGAGNYAKALGNFKILCEQNNNARACFSLAFMYENGQGLSVNTKEAQKYYEKACKNNFASACFNLALILDKDQLEKQADLNFYQACILGHIDGCKNLALRYEAKNDGLMAVDFYQRACKLKDGVACFKLGTLYDEGNLVRQNAQLASRSYAKACELNYANACYVLAFINLHKNDTINAKKHFGKACDLSHLSSCAEYKKLNKDQE